MEKQNTVNQVKPRRKKRSYYRRSLQCVLAVVLFAVIIVVGVANLISEDRTFSDNENRILASRPKISLETLMDGSYMQALEDYQADQFFARDRWISLKLWEDKMLGRQESNGVYLCQDDYLMEIPTETDMEVLQRNLDAVNSFASRFGTLNFQMMVVPSAANVMTEYLPENAPVVDRLADLQKVREALPENVSYIDVTKTLRDHVEEGVYYRTDHHWTSKGAYYAFREAADELGITEPLKEYNRYPVTYTFEGTLASKSGCHNVTDTIEVYEPVAPGSTYYVTYEDTKEKSRSLFVSSCLDEKDQYTVFFGGNHPELTIRTTNNNDRCLLIFKDSYANSFVQFLTPYYEEIILIDPRYYYDNVGLLIASEGVTDVLFLYSADTFLGDNSVADTLDAAEAPEEVETEVKTEIAAEESQEETSLVEGG